MKYIQTFDEFLNENYNQLNEKEKLNAKEAKKQKQDVEWDDLFRKLEDAEDDAEYYTEDSMGLVAKYKKIYKADDSEVTEISGVIRKKAGVTGEEYAEKAKDLRERASNITGKANKENDDKQRKLEAEAGMFEIYADIYHTLQKYQIRATIDSVKELTAYIKSNKKYLIDSDNNV